MYGDTDLAVCADCACFIANGDLTGTDPDGEAAILKAADREAGTLWVLACPDDCDGWFSMTPCDYCRRPLGGDRHPAAIIEGW